MSLASSHRRGKVKDSFLTFACSFLSFGGHRQDCTARVYGCCYQGIVARQPELPIILFATVRSVKVPLQVAISSVEVNNFGSMAPKHMEPAKGALAGMFKGTELAGCMFSP